MLTSNGIANLAGAIFVTEAPRKLLNEPFVLLAMDLGIWLTAAIVYDPHLDAFNELGGSGIALGVDEGWERHDERFDLLLLRIF